MRPPVRQGGQVHAGGSRRRCAALRHRRAEHRGPRGDGRCVKRPGQPRRRHEPEGGDATVRRPDERHDPGRRAAVPPPCVQQFAAQVPRRAVRRRRRIRPGRPGRGAHGEDDQHAARLPVRCGDGRDRVLSLRGHGDRRARFLVPGRRRDVDARRHRIRRFQRAGFRRDV